MNETTRREDFLKKFLMYLMQLEIRDEWKKVGMVIEIKFEYYERKIFNLIFFSYFTMQFLTKILC